MGAGGDPRKDFMPCVGGQEDGMRRFSCFRGSVEVEAKCNT